ncbi:MAG: hypothetical protein H0V72_21325, partial [Bradyrhizobium sp.]|nr:hypothetical protein [Bradyrhizobium sp.]
MSPARRPAILIPNEPQKPVQKWGDSMRRGVMLALGLLVASCIGAHAQEFPNRPITFIVPWSAGGATDIVCRALAAAAAKHLGQPIIVDN